MIVHRGVRDPFALYRRTIKQFIRFPLAAGPEQRRWLYLWESIDKSYRTGRLTDREFDCLLSKMP